jgi:hypothetical protein
MRERRLKFITTRKAKVVYKLFKVQDGKTSAFVARPNADGRRWANSHYGWSRILWARGAHQRSEDLTLTEFVLVTPDGPVLFDNLHRGNVKVAPMGKSRLSTQSTGS